MVKYAILILPNNLFDTQLVKEIVSNAISRRNKSADDNNTKDTPVFPKPDIVDVIMIEHPVFWGKRTDRPSMNFNPLKLVYHRASMYHWYHTEITDSGGAFKLRAKKYLAVDDYTQSAARAAVSSYDYVFYFEPCDKQLDSEIPSLLGSNRAICLDNPLFYNTLADLAKYHSDGKNSYTHASFYKWMRERIGFLPGAKTYDTENRSKMPVDTRVPRLPASGLDSNVAAKALRQGATAIDVGAVVSRRDVVSRLVFPIDRPSSLRWLRHFCRHRLREFGKYQDAIDCKGRQFLFHSCISPMLNIGLITPRDVIDEVQKYYEANKRQIPVASYEGFMRQVVGWREYQRYLYQYAYEAINGRNYFGNRRRLPATVHNPDSSKNPWYTGETGIPPVDDAIKQAWSTGYLHHIQRLMVIGNLMNLVGVHPDDVYRWFMEFALDSYDWVMVGNVYSMAMWADAGVSMRKPYISSDAYIMKMSTYARGGWNDIWYALFYDFVRRNSKQLSSTYYAGMVKNWNKKSPEEKKELQKRARKFIREMTSS